MRHTRSLSIGSRVANRAATAYCDGREHGRVVVDAERIDGARGGAHVQPGTLICRRTSSEAGHLIAVMQLEEGRGRASGGAIPKAYLWGRVETAPW